MILLRPDGPRIKFNKWGSGLENEIIRLALSVLRSTGIYNRTQSPARAF
jgi:hypothetical protein